MNETMQSRRKMRALIASCTRDQDVNKRRNKELGVRGASDIEQWIDGFTMLSWSETTGNKVIVQGNEMMF
ncbi:hypothetical protein BDU57DRAFT_523606 [Ampelomyces quisqualis]|uniref:Uncharacterized protein n=1 Tax=Ampelomyces quisqualis TaxID=50730 RepID=A0A6A5QBI1_AMPQU|nr:hypothetical protein BDU57DRAFT_523606 [Ampelomyces quisqualis]